MNNRFKFLYEDAGMLPKNVFHLRARYDGGSGGDNERCLELRDKQRLVTASSLTLVLNIC